MNELLQLMIACHVSNDPVINAMTLSLALIRRSWATVRDQGVVDRLEMMIADRYERLDAAADYRKEQQD